MLTARCTCQIDPLTPGHDPRPWPPRPKVSCPSPASQVCLVSPLTWRERVRGGGGVKERKSGDTLTHSSFGTAVVGFIWPLVALSRTLNSGACGTLEINGADHQDKVTCSRHKGVTSAAQCMLALFILAQCTWVQTRGTERETVVLRIPVRFCFGLSRSIYYRY